MTPTQLRAFRAVVRLGSVKEAAAELHVSEAAVSLHIGQLRRELEDQLFTRTGNGLAFTPGGLRLGADADRAGLHLDVAELVVKVVHFDEVLKVREADLHYGQEAVTTRIEHPVDDLAQVWPEFSPQLARNLGQVPEQRPLWVGQIRGIRSHSCPCRQAFAGP